MSEIGVFTIYTLHMRILRLSGVNLSKITQSLRGRAGIGTQVCLIPKPIFVTRMLSDFSCDLKL